MHIAFVVMVRMVMSSRMALRAMYVGNSASDRFVVCDEVFTKGGKVGKSFLNNTQGEDLWRHCLMGLAFASVLSFC